MFNLKYELLLKTSLFARRIKFKNFKSQIFNISIGTSASALTFIFSELLDADPRDVLELDELSSFLQMHRHKIWT